MDNSTAANLSEYTVRLQGADDELGTGFFVASGLILTCFHVVRASRAQNQPIQAWWQNQKYIATIEILPDNSEIDLALLRLDGIPHTHPCLSLDEFITVGDELYTFGYTREYINGEPATFVYEGLDGDIPPLLKFKAGQVRSGFSGSPLLNQKTGKICGVVKRSRDVDIDLGGRAVPTSVIFATFPQLAQLHQKPVIIAPNPFLPLNGPVEDQKQFFDRKRELNRVFETLNSGSSVAIIGERGIGKSSLLWAIQQQAETRLSLPRKPIYLNLTQVLDENDFYEALCYEVGVQVCKGTILTRILKSQNKHFLLLLDEIEAMTWDGFTYQLRGQLRGLAEGRDAPLRLVVAASMPLTQLFPDSVGMTSPFQGICIEERIKIWDEVTIQEFIKQRLAGIPVQFSELEIEQVINASRGFPREVMQRCHEIYRRYRDEG
jgi:hypothetical protein